MYIAPLKNEFNSVAFYIHDSGNPQGLAYIAANDEGMPVKVNRAIVDADVVLPIGCVSFAMDEPLSDCIYPAFGCRDAQDRYRIQKNTLASRTAEIELANDHLGSFYTIQVVAGPGGKIKSAFAGERKTAINLATDAYAATWRLNPVDEADMAIASIETDPDQQSWKDFARAVVSANLVANSNGPHFHMVKNRQETEQRNSQSASRII